VLQGGLTQVEPNRISNKKYNAQLLSATVKDALAVQGIPEAYDWLEEAVKQEDIPVGRALQGEADPGALGQLHEVGAGARVAPVQVIHPSPHPDNPELFWLLSEQARPSVFAPEAGLPKLRYLNPQPRRISYLVLTSQPRRWTTTTTTTHHSYRQKGTPSHR
jgi:hypothetical protein